MGVANELVIMQLISIKCLPILLYGSEVLDRPQRSALDFSEFRFSIKIFHKSFSSLIHDSLT